MNKFAHISDNYFSVFKNYNIKKRNWNKTEIKIKYKYLMEKLKNWNVVLEGN